MTHSPGSTISCLTCSLSVLYIDFQIGSQLREGSDIDKVVTKLQLQLSHELYRWLHCIMHSAYHPPLTITILTVSKLPVCGQVWGLRPIKTIMLYYVTISEFISARKVSLSGSRSSSMSLQKHQLDILTHCQTLTSQHTISTLDWHLTFHHLTASFIWSDKVLTKVLLSIKAYQLRCLWW